MPGICILANRLAIGGAELNLLSLLEHGLAKEEVVLVLFKQGSSLINRARRTGIRIIELNYDIKHRMLFVQSLYRVLQKLNPDVVHAILPGPSSYALLYKLVKPRTRVILNLHGSFLMMDKRRQYLDARFWRMADRIIVPSNFSKEEHIRIARISPDKISVIQNGLDSDRFRKIPIASSDEQEVHFGIIARLVPLKGHKILLHAFAKIIHCHPKSQLIIVGDGPARSTLETLATELGIKHNTRFTGNLENIPEILREIHVAILPSFTENFPISVLEALAAGRPVIATNVGGIPEAIDDGKNGFLIPTGDPDSLASAMLRFIENPALIDRFGSAARNRVLKQYTVQRNLKELLVVYHRAGVACY